MKFQYVFTACFLMQHIDVLCNDAFDDSHLFKASDCLVRWTWLVVTQTIDEFFTAFVIDRRITLKPMDVENSFSVGVFVETLRSTKIRDAT